MYIYTFSSDKLILFNKLCLVYLNLITTKTVKKITCFLIQIFICEILQIIYNITLIAIQVVWTQEKNLRLRIFRPQKCQFYQPDKNI